MKDDINILRSYITPSDRSPYGTLQNNKQQFSEESDKSYIFGSSQSKLENKIEYPLDNNHQGNGLSELSSLYGDADPRPLVRKNRIDRRYDTFPDEAFQPDVRHDDVMKENNEDQAYIQQTVNSYGNGIYGNKLQKSDYKANSLYEDTYRSESYYNYPSTVLKPSPSNIVSKDYVYGTRDSNPYMVEERYNVDPYEGWKDHDDENAYDLNYLLRNLI